MDSFIGKRKGRRRVLHASQDGEGIQNVRSTELKRELDAMLARGEELVAELKRTCEEGATRGWSVWRYTTVALDNIQERVRAVVSKYEQIWNTIEDYKEEDIERKRFQVGPMTESNEFKSEENDGPTTVHQPSASEKVEPPSNNDSLALNSDSAHSSSYETSSDSPPRTPEEDEPFSAPELSVTEGSAPITPLPDTNELGSMTFEGFYTKYLSPIFKDDFKTFRIRSLARAKKEQYDDITIVNGYDQAIQKFTRLVFNTETPKDSEAVETFTTNPPGNWGGSIGTTHLARLVTFMAVVLKQPIEERREVYIENLLHPTNGPGGLTRILVKSQHVERIARKVDFLDVQRRPCNPEYLKYKNSNNIQYEKVTQYPDLDFTFEYEVSKLPPVYRNRFIQVEEYTYQSKTTGEDKRDKTSYDILIGPSNPSIRERLTEQGKEIIQKERFKDLVPRELLPPQYSCE